MVLFVGNNATNFVGYLFTRFINHCSTIEIYNIYIKNIYICMYVKKRPKSLTSMKSTQPATDQRFLEFKRLPF
jgi:hypothetical protein